MQYRRFTLASADEAAERELNSFLRGHRILDVQSAYDQRQSAWMLLVSFIDGQLSDGASPARRNREDPAKDLSPELKVRYEKLAAIRREMARRDAIAAFHVFTNAELVSIAQLEPPLTVKAIASVSGVGEKRAEQYGGELLRVDNEEGGEPDGENCPF